MARLAAWMGAGAVAAGVSAALIAGADVASADTGSESDTSKSSASEKSSDKSDAPGPRRPDTSDTTDKPDKADTADTTEKVSKAGNNRPGGRAATKQDVPADDDAADSEPSAPAAGGSEGNQQPDPQGPPVSEDVSEPVVAVDEPQSVVAEPAPVVAESESTESESTESESTEPPAVEPAAISTKAAERPAVSTKLSSSTTLAVPQMRSLPELIGSFVFDIIGAAVTFVSGAPVVPHGSKVVVRRSSLEITEGRFVPAHWYYPDSDEAPQRIIYLQHGFLGVGAMYSYTAALLAERTNSVVVVPTLTSNRYVQDGFWLGDDQANRATANLFLGGRDALTASALAAGYATKYGADAVLPDSFLLVGHSLGGGLVAGTAGHYAEAIGASGAENHLAGVVLLDAALSQEAMATALDKLDGLGYIPVLELGAPKDVRRVDAALNEHRPGLFNGVVLTGGKHLDSMMGGTPFIQFVSHLYQGFPTRQNQLAAQTLIAGWADDMFAAQINPTTGKCDGEDCAGIYGDLGETISLDTPAGPTSGAVIGAPATAVTTEFRPAPVTALVAPRSRLTKSLMLRV